jgi:hypothetical protein
MSKGLAQKGKWKNLLFNAETEMKINQEKKSVLIHHSPKSRTNAKLLQLLLLSS